MGQDIPNQKGFKMNDWFKTFMYVECWIDNAKNPKGGIQ